MSGLSLPTVFVQCFKTDAVNESSCCYLVAFYFITLTASWLVDIYMLHKEEMEFMHINKKKIAYDNLDQDIKDIWTWEKVKKAAIYQ
jgi:hypothetical protein